MTSSRLILIWVNWATRVKWDTESECKGWRWAAAPHCFDIFQKWMIHSIPLSHLLPPCHPPLLFNPQLKWTCIRFGRQRYVLVFSSANTYVSAQVVRLTGRPVYSMIEQREKHRCSCGKAPLDGTKPPRLSLEGARAPHCSNFSDVWSYSYINSELRPKMPPWTI